MKKRTQLLTIATSFMATAAGLLLVQSTGPSASRAYAASYDADNYLNGQLERALVQYGFTGKIEQSFHERLEANLGRPINPKLADLGRMLWFDKIHALHQDNTCGGCHSPTNGFGDSQPMAIGIQNNNLVGPDRAGPRNQRRTPLAINTALYPALMWNGRFNSSSGDPFDNSQGFHFPPPEDDTRFSFANDIKNHQTHLLQAHGQLPPTELTEVVGYTGTCPNGIPDPTLGEAFCQFDDGKGKKVPLPDDTGFRNDPIRQRILVSLNASPEYRRLFGKVFPEVQEARQLILLCLAKLLPNLNSR